VKQTASIRPPYSQVVICDLTAKVVVPEWEKGVPLVATDTCILCGCMPDMDGETDFTLGPGGELEAERFRIFEGIPKTPGRRIALETVWGDPLLGLPAASTVT
jgi:hypothetical protein